VAAGGVETPPVAAGGVETPIPRRLHETLLIGNILSSSNFGD